MNFSSLNIFFGKTLTCKVNKLSFDHCSNEKDICCAHNPCEYWGKIQIQKFCDNENFPSN